MIQPTTQIPKKINRKRELNVIYFIDSAKTRSFKFPLGRVKLVGAFLGLVAIWAVGSFWVLVKLSNQQELANARITHSQRVIFEYQTRYAQVYENAYPKSERLMPEELVAEVTNESKKQSIQGEHEVEPLTQKLAAKPVKKAPAADNNLKAPSKAENGQENSVEVADSKFTSTGDSLNLHFSLRNNTSPQKIVGYMWSVAAYRTDAGNLMYVGYPRGINIDRDGNATNTDIAPRFNIRRFKPVKMTFPSPQGVPGKFENVKVMVTDHEGHSQSYNLPVSIHVGLKPMPSPRPVTKVLPDVPDSEVQNSPGVENDEMPAMDEDAKALEGGDSY